MEKPIILTVVAFIFIATIWAQSINMNQVKEKQVAVLSDQGMSS